MKFIDSLSYMIAHKLNGKPKKEDEEWKDLKKELRKIKTQGKLLLELEKVKNKNMKKEEEVTV